MERKLSDRGLVDVDYIWMVTLFLRDEDEFVTPYQVSNVVMDDYHNGLINCATYIMAMNLCRPYLEE